MLLQICIETLIFLMEIYYVTIFLHFMGISLFVEKSKVDAEETPVADAPADAPVVEKAKTEDTKKFEISLGLALIPFYYWFKRDTTV